MLRVLMSLFLLCALPHGAASATTAKLPAQERLASCDPQVALAAADEIIKSPESLQEPLQVFGPALVLFQHGRKEDAVFWFYAAQMRARQQLVFEKGDRGQLLAIMMGTVGMPINNYAFQDTRRLDRTLERVLQWDRTTPNPFKEKTRSPDTDRRTEEVYRGFAELRKKIAAERSELERKAREAAPQIEQSYASMRPAPCQKGQMDPAYAAQAQRDERPLVLEFVRNHKEVIRELGAIKSVYPDTFRIRPGELLPSRYEFSVNGDKKATAIVDVARDAGKAEFSLACLSHTPRGQRQAGKDPCKQ